MKLLIYNCGLLRLRSCCGCELFANPPHADDRFEKLAAMLLSSNADIIALQEIYEEAHVRRLQAEVRSVYPHMARGDRRCCFQKAYKFHNGLMILSKFPIMEEATIKHSKAAFAEKLLGSKCLLMARIDAGEHGKYTLVNMHTTAGGGLHPEAVDAVRQSELQEAIDECTKGRADGFYKAMVIGDLNMGPEASPDNYHFMKAKEFQDAVEQCAPDISAVCTWDPNNPLNMVGPHAKCPPQRCDHVFVHNAAYLKGAEMRLMFTDSMVELTKGKRKGEKSTLSDHYGILLTLENREP